MSVKKAKLADVLGPSESDGGSIRWRVTVPLGTNPFLLFELAQFALVGACIVLITLCVGIWITEDGIYESEIFSMLRIAAMVFLAIVAGFIAIAVLFFGNRYYATFHIDGGGIYHEGSRGSDERAEGVCLRMKPYPVLGAVTASRTRSRHLVWEKTDSFQDFSSMRVILLKRGRWNMVRLYTPDAATHERVMDVLAMRLKKI